MNLYQTLASLTRTSVQARFLEAVHAGNRVNLQVLPGLRPLLLAQLGEQDNRLKVVVTASGRRAEELTNQLNQMGSSATLFPAWETLPHERLSPRIETMAARLSALRRLTKPDPTYPTAGAVNFLVVPLRALLQHLPAGLGELVPLRLREGQDYGPQQVLRRLLELGYERTDMVATRGQVVARGGIVDVFVPGEPHPQRIEFFGDSIDEIRYFSIADQRTVKRCENGVWAPACRELIVDDATRERAGEVRTRYPELAETLELISEGIAVPGMESLFEVLGYRSVSLDEYLPEGSAVILEDPERLARQEEELLSTSAEFAAAAWQSSAVGGEKPLAVGAGFIGFEEIQERFRERDFSMVSWSEFSLSAEELEVKEPPFYRGDIPRLVQEVGDYLNAGWQVLLATRTTGSAERFTQNLREEGLAVILCASAAELAAALSEGAVTVKVFVAPLTDGFMVPEQRILLLTEKEVTGRGQNLHRAVQKLPSRRRSTAVDPLALKPGDYVVHQYHGVARFLELTNRMIGAGKDKATREYLVLEYAPSHRGQPGDRLYVPTDSLDQITRYTGSDAPSLNKMGGSDWAKTKSKARKATREIAGELIRLYAARRASEGFAFSPDTPWQRELEEAFIYAETPDQLLTIDEVKADMEKPIPMDRLLCGDVGYGKTEVAVRAAFKAIQDGKQVAVLVPTTLLVNQHYETFSERYAPFPVKIGQLSRFTSAAQARKIKEQLSRGEIDLVIGTHTLLTGDVRFKDLGLVIIDEEQRFGVEHKETLKALRTNVDVLAMSATPIPRTLEMAVTGIRELSTLTTPPEDRHPILTSVGPLHPQQVKAAIKRELMRDGQVFYVHNRVQSIDRTAAALSELVPEARICVAHGRMGEKQLERVMVDFWNHEYDVLVCTTIVETGLDIANANTLIVENAQKMGLSQLHQLRGRVGRARERAYAYFFYPPEQTLSELAYERLTTIAANTDLGAGALVAQKDLEIRGAGNLLGGEQSGHIAGVGFDLYIRMVSEAVTNYRAGVVDGAERAVEEPEMRVELHLDAHIPQHYIDSERLRLEIYQKISAARDDATLEEIAAELRDRYGEFPEPVRLLFTMARLRQLLREKEITDVVIQGKYLRVGPIELAESQTLRLKRLYPGTVLKLAVRQVLVPIPTGKKLGEGKITGDELVEWTINLIDKVLTSPVPF